MRLTVVIGGLEREYCEPRRGMNVKGYAEFLDYTLSHMAEMTRAHDEFRDLEDQISKVALIGDRSSGIDQFVYLVEANTEWRLVVYDEVSDEFLGNYRRVHEILPAMEWLDKYEPPSEPERQANNVDHPLHYQLPGLPCESIDVIRAVLGDEGFCKFCRGNALKYLIRADHKGGTEDLEKAMKYIGWERDTREGHFSPDEQA